MNAMFLRLTSLLLLMALPMVLVALACGGGDVEAPTPTEQPATQPTTQPAAPAAPTSPPTQPSGDMSDEPFRIGVMESVTGPGETYGNVAVQAKQMAVDEINAAGGVNGRKLELIVEDEKVQRAGLDHRLSKADRR